MKTGNLFVYGGSAVLLAITTLSGCKGPEVMQTHTYARAADQPQQPSETTPAQPVTPVASFSQNTNPSDNAPAIQPETPAQYPAFNPTNVTTPFQGAEGKTYTVKAGDSLWVIAKRHGISVEDLKAYNNLNDKSKLQIGKTLRLPPGAMAEGNVPVSTKHKKTTEKPIAAKKSEKTEKTTSAKKTESAVPVKEKSDDGKTYVVKKGDFWAKIAKAHHVSAASLADANKKKITDTLQIGQKLVIPAAEAKTEAKSTAKNGKATKHTETSETDAVETEVEVGTAKTDVKANVKSGKKSAKSEVKTETKTDDILKDMPEDAPKSVNELKNELNNKTVKTKDVDVPEDTTVAQFAAKNGVSVEEVKKNNPQIMDDKLKKGDLVTIPE